MRTLGTHRRRAVWVVVGVMTLSGCALPHDKHLGDTSKGAVTLTAGGSLLSRFSRAKSEADTSLDATELAKLETGATLAVDKSAFTIRRQLGLAPAPTELASPATILAPRFGRYPLWFVAITGLSPPAQQVAAVFTRASATAPWLVATAPRLAASTRLPTLAQGSAGGVVKLQVTSNPPVWDDGAAATFRPKPQDIADEYADVLTSPKSPYADEFVTDSFLTQMRTLRAEQPQRDARVSQTWEAGPVRYVLRLFDGGALMFVTLSRTDTYTVVPGHHLGFNGSEASAYITQAIKRSARLHYLHQILMVVPAQGQPLVIGQYGGLVSASGR